MKIHGWMSLSVVVMALVGCGPGGTDQPAAKGPEGTELTSVRATETGQSPADTEEEVGEPPIEATASPAEVVTFFLDSLRAGNRNHVASTLTKKAREETAREGLVVQPIGTPDAKYEVGTVEYVGTRKDGAHVQSIWTEVDEAGTSVTYDVIWVLRRQETGWRIAGMATQMNPGDSPEFLNFENPREMLNKIEESAGDSASRAETASREDEPPRKPTRSK